MSYLKKAIHFVFFFPMCGCSSVEKPQIAHPLYTTSTTDAATKRSLRGGECGEGGGGEGGGGVEWV